MQGSFVGGPLEAQFLGRGQIVLTRELVWCDDDGTVTIPVGTVSDGASIPRWAWSLIAHPFEGTVLRAAVLHDHLIATRADWSALAHRRFYRALRAEGAGVVRAAVLYAAVAIGGPRW
jgi:hypothetical protein